MRFKFLGKIAKGLMVVVFCFLMIIMLFVACGLIENKVLVSLGRYDDHVFYSEGEFQDYTDYAKYYYTHTNLAKNKYLKKIKESDFIRINEHLDDFESWIETYRENDATREIVVNYDFDRAIIDTEDYIYIESEKHTWEEVAITSLVNYDVYFFDTQTNVLYFFHNNI